MLHEKMFYKHSLPHAHFCAFNSNSPANVMNILLCIEMAHYIILSQWNGF